MTKTTSEQCKREHRRDGSIRDFRDGNGSDHDYNANANATTNANDHDNDNDPDNDNDNNPDRCNSSETATSSIDELIREAAFWYAKLRQDSILTEKLSPLHIRKTHTPLKYESHFRNLLDTLPVERNGDLPRRLRLSWDYQPDHRNPDVGDACLGFSRSAGCFELVVASEPLDPLRNSEHRKPFSLLIPLQQRPLSPEFSEDSASPGGGSADKLLASLLSLIAKLSGNATELVLEGFGAGPVLRWADLVHPGNGNGNGNADEIEGEVFRTQQPYDYLTRKEEARPWAPDDDPMEWMEWEPEGVPFSQREENLPSSIPGGLEIPRLPLSPFGGYHSLLQRPLPSYGSKESEALWSDRNPRLPVAALELEHVFRAFAVEETSSWRTEKLAILRVQNCVMDRDHFMEWPQPPATSMGTDPCGYFHPRGLEEVYIHDPKTNFVSSTIFEVASFAPKLNMLYAFDKNNHPIVHPNNHRNVVHYLDRHPDRQHGFHRHPDRQHGWFRCTLTPGAVEALGSILSQTNELYGTQQLPYREIFHVPEDSFRSLIKATFATTALATVEDNLWCLLRSRARNHHSLTTRTRHTASHSLAPRRFAPGTWNTTNNNINNINININNNTANSTSNSNSNRSTSDFRDFAVRSSALHFCLVLKRSLEALRGVGERGLQPAVPEGTAAANHDADDATTNLAPVPTGSAKLAPRVLARCQTKPLLLNRLIGDERDLLFMVLRESLVDIVSSR